MATKGKMVKGTSGKDVLKGGAGNDTLYGYAGNDNLQGGAGNDNLRGGAGNDTLTGGVGKDTFAYANGEGKDIINDYKAGQDTLYISSGAISKTSLSGKNIIFTVGKGSVTLKNAATQTISLRDSRGSYTMSKTALALTSNFGGTMDAAKYLATVKTLDGSKTTKAVNLYGNAAANTIKGGSGKNTLLGYAGNDYLYGYASNDVLNGGVGNDYLDGGKGSDALTGGAGNDVFVYRDGDGADTINDYEQGKDTFYLAKGAFKSAAVSGNNLVFNVGSGKVTMKNAAARTITLKNADGGIYTMTKTALTAKSGFGGTMSAATHLSTITNVNAAAATKASVLYGNSQANTITGGSANDKLYGNAGNDKLNGGAGNNTLTGGAGADVFSCGVGNDTIADYAAGQDTIDLGSLTVSAVEIVGSDSVLTLSNGRKVTVRNGQGKDLAVKTKNGTEYIHFIDGTDENDALNGAAKSDYIRGFGGNDTIQGLGGNDILDGGADDDLLNGGAGDDTLTGGNGNDTFVYTASEGNDVITDYTEGHDGLRINISGGGRIVSRNGSNVVISFGKYITGSVTLKNGINKKIAIIENGYYSYNLLVGDGLLHGTSGIDWIYGGSGNNTLEGGDGDDNLFGGAGNSTLYGGAGYDNFYGGTGKDVFVHESGDDTITDYESGKDAVWFQGTTLSSSKSDLFGNVILTLANGETIKLENTLGKEITYVDSSGTTKKITVDDTIYGTSNGDDMTGTSGDDRMDGLAGNDTMHGGTGRDFLYGGAGDDVLYADTRGDQLYGGIGNDVLHGSNDEGIGNPNYLYGGEGDDTLYGGKNSCGLIGGAGKDLFVIESARNGHHISDYTVGEDTIRFNGSINAVWLDGNSVNLFLSFTNEANNGTISIINGVGKEITYIDSSGVSKTLTVNSNGGVTYGSASAMVSSSSMMANSAPIVGSSSAQLASLVSMTQVGNLGAMPGPGTGLVSDNAAEGRLVVANGTAATNPLTNQRTA